MTLPSNLLALSGPSSLFLHLFFQSGVEPGCERCFKVDRSVYVAIDWRYGSM